MTSLRTLFGCALALGALWLLGACDSGITGTPVENQPPETALSVRDTSLVDNLPASERLASTVLVSWSGSDSDGFVAAFEIRFFDRLDRNTVGAEEGWTRTTGWIASYAVSSGSRPSSRRRSSRVLLTSAMAEL